MFLTRIWGSREKLGLKIRPAVCVPSTLCGSIIWTDEYTRATSIRVARLRIPPVVQYRYHANSMWVAMSPPDISAQITKA